ncbi:MBL fold metallo-hydrolase RNA specificity domain-containing protein [Undibacterium baiyunense]|uniref:MBL fold metallo-hydrolase n=1 Tax=Undibacterium baiyunense TaxID=2828731 RepID=A0A941I2A1_9BURK|nr:MBL fold metallo-hydrolase [Undibacterium baiyunense]MBR7747278.1 MBL fold metallo-hydrolase [Undibacterium baiyunense]
MKISFHGANKDVTGSCHLIECAGKKVLIDCGLFQGGHDLSDENTEDFGFDPAEIDYLLLTHAHLDHCGRIPLLVKRGFRGEIITSAASKDLARLVLLDSAHLQEADARAQLRKQQRHSQKRVTQDEPLYTLYDATRSFDFFGRVAHYNKAIKVAPGITATFYDAGHILGSASIYLELKEGRKTCWIVFSGDIGSKGRKILRDPVIPPPADIVVMETTYGDRLHRSLDASVKEFYQAINDTFEHGGNVIIPTFALERAQEILWYLREGVEKGKLPAAMHVFLDSPMAISATEIFRDHPECYDEEAAKLLKQKRDPFQLNNLHITHDAADSMAINRITSGAVILAGAGMCNGGRVRHHLKHHLWRRNASVIFVGFAARGTLARQIIDGAKSVRLFGEEIDVNANVYTINGFSAHADRAELLAWQKKITPTHTVLVHGEEDVMQSFASQLKNTEIHIPQKNQRFSLPDFKILD